MTLEPNSPLSDSDFDKVYNDIGCLSAQHWTPVAVGVRAARILTRLGATRILDIGSGADKFCIVGALATSAEFHGVEQRKYLVDMARSAALQFQARRAHFVHANALTISFEDYDGFYLYNPFHEQMSQFTSAVDLAAEPSATTFRNYVSGTIEKLVALPKGTPIVSYSGFGGKMPSSYHYIGDEPAGNDSLELWVKE